MNVNHVKKVLKIRDGQVMYAAKGHIDYIEILWNDMQFSMMNMQWQANIEMFIYSFSYYMTIHCRNWPQNFVSAHDISFNLVLHIFYLDQ